MSIYFYASLYENKETVHVPTHILNEKRASEWHGRVGVVRLQMRSVEHEALHLTSFRVLTSARPSHFLQRFYELGRAN